MPNTRLDFVTADIIFDSWDAIKRIPDYDVVVGEKMFRKIFSDSPSTLKVFSFGSSFAGREEAVYTSKTFEIHAKAMIKMLEDVLSMLMPDLVPMKRTLKSLGARHMTYGVLPNHYTLATEALLSALQDLLGINSQWTPKVEEAWKTAFGFITNTMIAGANNLVKKRQEQRKLSLEHSSICASDRTTWEEPISSSSSPTTSRKVSFDNDVHKELIDCDDTSGTMSTSGSDSFWEFCEDSDVNYMKLIEDVYDSWDIIKRIPNYSQVTGKLLFQNIFEVSPQAKDLFQFSKQYQSNDDDDEALMYKDVAFLIHAKGVIEMLDTCVGMMGPDMEPVSKALEELGARHCQYDVDDEHYSVVGEALLKTLETLLKSAWTPQLEESWTGVYAFMFNAMQKGAREFKNESLDSHVEI